MKDTKDVKNSEISENSIKTKQRKQNEHDMQGRIKTTHLQLQDVVS